MVRFTLLSLTSLLLCAQVDVRLNHPNNSTVDAFGNLRVVSPRSLFESTLEYSKQPQQWNELLAGGASAAVYNQNASAISMTIGTGSGARIVRQSKLYTHYQPGKSQKIIMTGTFNGPKANLTQRMGYFDDANGVFFQYSGTTLGVVVRSSVTGTVSDNAVARANWNMDKLDGNGPSGLVAHFDKAHIYHIDLQWAVGRVRFGVLQNGLLIYVHQTQHSNTITLPYMTSANLPVRYEILNTATTASASTLTQIHSAVMSEGGQDIDNFFTYGVSNSVARTAASATEVAILTIRPKATFGNKTNRIPVYIQDFTVLVNSNEVGCRLVIGDITLGSTDTWISAGTNSSVEYNEIGTTVTGGDTIMSFLSGDAAAATVGQAYQVKQRIPLSLDIAGSVADKATIACTGLGGSGSVRVAINFIEVR